MVHACNPSYSSSRKIRTVVQSLPRSTKKKKGRKKSVKILPKKQASVMVEAWNPSNLGGKSRRRMV
jgi:hypothetical protein